MSIAALVVNLMAALLNMDMETKEHRPALTEEERAEKLRLKRIYKKFKNEWRLRGEKLTDDVLAELVAEAVGRESPYSQGAIWQFTSENSSTRIPDEFAHGMAKALGFNVDEISPRFTQKLHRLGVDVELFGEKDQDGNRALYAILEAKKTGQIKPKNNDLVIPQYSEVVAAMGNSRYLLETEGEIYAWSVSQKWAENNIPANTGIKNLRIITGMGNSMQGMFNSGDPLIVDSGVNSVDYDAVYFFRVGDEGFVKTLQRVPGEGVRVLSKNPDFPPWTIKEGMDVEIFGRVLKVWEGKEM